MADEKKPATANGGAPVQMQVRVLGQYIKDLSFESPNVAKLVSSPPENPNINLALDVAVAAIAANVHEVTLTFRAQTRGASIGPIYELELDYAGLLGIENAPPEALDIMLHVNAPALLFPFLRRIVADLTREGGFPPLMLDPVDFGALYMRKKQAEQAGGPRPGA